MAVLVEASNVRVEFGDLVAVAGVSFAMRGGDLLGLIGPNGAGKTTLLRVLAGLQAPVSGTARIMGHDVLKDWDQVRGRVGFAPAGPPAYEELTIEQFLYFVADTFAIRGAEATERIDYWLEQAWLDEKRREKIATLSTGMRQRVTVVQTLMTNSAVVLLDEPSAGLDPAGRIQLRRIIASLAAQGKAVIVSSHILADLEEYCTHIAILERGRLLRYAHVDELSTDGAPRAVYLVSVAGDGDASTQLAAVEGVTNVAKNGRSYTLEYEAGDEAAARLVRTLVEQRMPLTSFTVARATLEDVYLKTGVRQVD